MLIEGSKILPVARATVWQALNDTAFLRATLPDCQALTQTEDDYRATLSSAIGPVRASFDVTFRRSVDVPLQSCTLTGQGDGGVAGSAQGAIRITLSDVEHGTLLHYTADTVIHGKIAQLGSRLINSAARKFSEKFFQNVLTQLSPQTNAEPTVHTPPDHMLTPAHVAPDHRHCASRIQWQLPIACGIGCFVGVLSANYISRYLP